MNNQPQQKHNKEQNSYSSRTTENLIGQDQAIHHQKKSMLSFPPAAKSTKFFLFLFLLSSPPSRLANEFIVITNNQLDWLYTVQLFKPEKVKIINRLAIWKLLTLLTRCHGALDVRKLLFSGVVFKFLSFSPRLWERCLRYQRVPNYELSQSYYY